MALFSSKRKLLLAAITPRRELLHLIRDDRLGRRVGLQRDPPQPVLLVVHRLAVGLLVTAQPELNLVAVFAIRGPSLDKIDGLAIHRELNNSRRKGCGVDLGVM